MHSFRQLIIAGLAMLSLASFSLAEEEPPDASTAAPQKGAHITFLPPPIEGHITLGLFDSQKKLVHVLRQEATKDDFIVGLNGFIVHWDGTDGAGKPLPPGKYQARGYSVGGVQVEGVAFHGNDWLSTEESPRLTRVIELALDPAGNLRVKGALPEAVDVAHFRYDSEADQLVPVEAKSVFPRNPLQQLTPDSDPQQVAATAQAGDYLLANGKLWKVADGKAEVIEYEDLGRVISACSGRDSTLWIIDESPEGLRAVKQFSASGELLRAMPAEPADPPPVQIMADLAKDAIHLLEVSSASTRVRSLVLEKLEQAEGEDGSKQVSTWRTALSKTIRSSGEFSETVASEMRGKPFTPEKSINLRLVPNPLFRNQPATVDVKVVAAPEGAVLQTADGLPLKHLTETRGLRWVAMARETGSRAVVLLQSDGAVVEEFRIRQLGQMMAFDAGTYEVK